MTDLVARLREAIDETERIAQAAEQENWRWYAEDKTVMTHGQDGEWEGYRTTGTRADAEHIARHDPAAVLRRCAADRKILDEHPGFEERTGWDEYRITCATCRYDGGTDIYHYPCPTVTALAEYYQVEA